MRPYRLGPSPRIASGDGRGRRFFTIAAAPLLFAVLTPSQAGWTSIRSVILVTRVIPSASCNTTKLKIADRCLTATGCATRVPKPCRAQAVTI